MERRKTTNENDKGLMIGRNSSVIYISDSFFLVHSYSYNGDLRYHFHILEMFSIDIVSLYFRDRDIALVYSWPSLIC